MTQTPTDPTVLVIGPPAPERRRGRPRVAEPRTVSLHVRLTERQFDQISCYCLRHNAPVTEVIRRWVSAEINSRL